MSFSWLDDCLGVWFFLFEMGSVVFLVKGVCFLIGRCLLLWEERYGHVCLGYWVFVL